MSTAEPLIEDPQKPWCISCQHTHITTMPVYTYACAHCGFGAHARGVALDHKKALPEHEVYPEFHRMVPRNENHTPKETTL